MPLSIEDFIPSDGPRKQLSEPHGFIAHFFEKFCRMHQFMPGKRHEFLLKLGASARRQGFNLEELNQLIALAESHCLAPDYAPGEIARNITDSYHFTENRMAGESYGFGVKGHNSPWEKCKCVLTELVVRQDVFCVSLWREMGFSVKIYRVK